MVGDVAFKPGGDAPPAVPPLSRVCKLLLGPNGVPVEQKKEHAVLTASGDDPKLLEHQKVNSVYAGEEGFERGLTSDAFHRCVTSWTDTDVPEHPELLKLASKKQAEAEEDTEDIVEEKIKFDSAVEMRRSVLATLITIAMWAIIFLIFTWGASVTSPPDCSNPPEDLDICDRCAPKGYVLPIFPEFEQSLHQGAKIALYFVGLLWTFLGIGIICDQFMAAIEKITSAEKTVWVEVREGAKHKFRKKVWNGTVANLSLMALGSSAPEIILNVVEITGSGFFAGELGPSTIVGSAAFNLLVITAVCIAALPDNETRKIAEKAVFSVTTGCSVFAYMWLVFILEVNTKDLVDLWEALATFAFFPLLLGCAFVADKGYFVCSLNEDTAGQSAARAALEEKYGPNLSQETLQLLLRKEEPPKTNTMSKAAIRKALMSGFLGGKKLFTSQETDGGAITVGFEKSGYMVLECAGHLELKVPFFMSP